MKRLAGVLLLLAAVGLPPVAPAQAEVTYDFSFGSGLFYSPPGSSGGGPIGIGVNRSTGGPQSGYVYVTDRLGQRVMVFDSAGAFVRTWGRGVNQTSGGDVCPRPGNPGDVCQPGQTGSGSGWFFNPTAVAVDTGGDVYIEDGENARVQKFSADGGFLFMLGKGVNQTSGGDICPRPGQPGDVCKAGEVAGDSTPGQFAGWGARPPRNAPVLGTNIAVDGSDNLYVGDPYANPSPRVQKFDPAGAFVGQVAPPLDYQDVDGGFDFIESMTVNAAGDLYVDNPHFLGVYDASDFTTDGTSAAREWAFGPRGYGILFEADSPNVPAVDPYNQYLFALNPAVKCLDFEESENPFYPDNGGTAIYEYHPMGQEVDCTTISYPQSTFFLSAATGGPSAHKLYLVNAGAQRIDVYDTPVASPPTLGEQSVEEITATGAATRTQIAANLDDTTYHVEYGTSPCSDIPNPCASTPESAVGASFTPEPVLTRLTGLSPDTTYYYRFVATNGEGTDEGPDNSFHTFTRSELDVDCPNNLARQQTGAAFLLDCRAYELVSAEDTGGYNVESDLVAGETPFAGYPGAEGRALYGVHNGLVPNSGGKPTNRGLDPYLATRDQAHQRWNTTYVGIPADAPSAAPFSSTLAEASGVLASFAFGGADLCDPCFGDGSVGVPIHRPDGSLVQGMAGSLPVALPVPAATVRKHFSKDGRYFVFGSKQAFEPGANSNNADATLYERDLDTGTTEIVSTDDTGSPIQNGVGIAELDISADGQRVVFGKKLGQDAAGNPLYRLFMHLRNAPDSYQLTPGAVNGALYAGMTRDGSKVFFTTADKLTGDDDDDSADFYETAVSPYAALSIRRVSTGESGTGDTDSCAPVANSFNDHWNVVPGGPADCSALAIGGGGGVASESGAVYFLSPEQLDTSGPTQPVQDAPNLYLARPGEDPKFVATLESELTGPQPSLHSYGFKQSIGGLAKVTGLAVDRSSGDFYVFDATPKVIKKFDAAGNPVNFTAGQGAGTNQLNGSDAPTGAFLPSALSPAGIAVDQASGKLYVPDFSHNRVDVFKSSGQYDSQLTVTSPSAVAIHPTTHDVYVTTRAATGKVTIFPVGGGASTNFTTTSLSNPSGVAVDSTGRVYAVNNNQAVLYSAAGAFVKVFDANPSSGVAVDPADDDVFINEKIQIAQFDSSGAPTEGSDGAGAPFGIGTLSNSVAIALDASANAYASNDDTPDASPNNTAVAVFERSLNPDRRNDNPLVLHSLSEAGTRHSAEFQTTPDGEAATFSSLLALDGFDSADHYEVFHYDAPAEELACASCNPTGSPPSADASLAADGLSLTDDGRVFFTSGEQLVLRDTDARKDAYEWKEGKVELISSGQSRFDSGLLSVSADGTDAFFFTRDVLASNDGNGNLTKLYDAREGGGFFVIPPSPQCAASDECHGAGSPTPPAPSINTLSSPPVGNLPGEPRPKPCRRGKVRRHGRCVTHPSHKGPHANHKSRHPSKRGRASR